MPYSSIEQIIENNKEAYYRALRLTQKTLNDDEPDWSPWMVFFLQTLVKQKHRLETRLQQEQVLIRQDLTRLEMQVLELLKTRGKVTNAEFVTLTGASRNTLKSSLKKLVGQKLIGLHGKGRGAFYRPVGG